jgi:hypothetical protein
VNDLEDSYGQQWVCMHDCGFCMRDCGVGGRWMYLIDVFESKSVGVYVSYGILLRHCDCAMGWFDDIEDTTQFDRTTRNGVSSYSYLWISLFLFNVIVEIISKSFSNWTLNFGLIFETCLMTFLAYCPGLDNGLRMYGLR